MEVVELLLPPLLLPALAIRLLAIREEFLPIPKHFSRCGANRAAATVLSQ